jgi:outer membrane protein TolC
MGRAPEAPLGAPPEDAIRLEAAAAGAAADELDEQRPEIAGATRMVRRSEAALDLAQRASRWPSVTVGADYWYLPQQSSPNAYGAMVSIDLPWLSPRYREQIVEAEHTLAADRYAREAQRNQARFEVRDARVRVDAAMQAVRIIDGDLLPLARRSFESAEAAYEAGQGSALALLDAMRSYLQVRLERTRALARLDASRADYDRAAGIDAGGSS